MATIINTDSTVEIQFLIKRSDKKEWFNYKVEIYMLNKNTKEKTLLKNVSLINDQGLYLDAYYDPELPLFIEGLQQVRDNHSDFFSFTPVDEKDFVFELKKAIKEDYYFLSFFIDNQVSNVWEGIRIMVDKNEITQFINNIALENDKLSRLI